MSATLMARVYGKPLPVDHIVEYGEHEVSFGTADWERVRYAVVYFGGELNTVTNVDLRDLYIEQNEPHYLTAAEWDARNR